MGQRGGVGICGEVRTRGRAAVEASGAVKSDERSSWKGGERSVGAEGGVGVGERGESRRLLADQQLCRDAKSMFRTSLERQPSQPETKDLHLFLLVLYIAMPATGYFFLALFFG